MKFDWTISKPALIKIVGMSASGKSAKVQVTIDNWSGGTHTYPVETVRMDNIISFISQEVNFRDKIEANLDEFEIEQGLLL